MANTSADIAPFQDYSFRFADTDTSRSSDMHDGIPKAQTLNDFFWESTETSVIKATLEGPTSDRNSLLAKDKNYVGDMNNDAIQDGTVSSHARLVDSCRTKTEEDETKKTKPEQRKRRDIRDILCNGIIRLLNEIISLVNGGSPDTDGIDIEYGPIRFVPHSLPTLMKTTHFTKEELKTMYRTFKNECPTGVVYEDTLKSIYSQFFPDGDANMYAHYLFNAFDNNQEGYISFEDFVTSLSSLLRGKFEEKLQWVFKLYDINHDGFITKEEIHDIVKSVYSLMGTAEGSPVYPYAEHANRVFQKLDRNNDGYVTYPEFVDACSKDPSVVASMKVFETDL